MSAAVAVIDVCVAVADVVVVGGVVFVIVYADDSLYDIILYQKKTSWYLHVLFLFNV